MSNNGDKPAVFLDRDGTLNIERTYLCDPDKLEFFPDVVDSLTTLRDAGFLLFIVTNQSGIGRGYYTEEDMHAVNNRLVELLAPAGIKFEQIYYAPEHPDEESPGRKPSPQFLLDAARDHGVDLAASYMIGDKLSDIRCGWNAGVHRSLLVLTGYGAEVAEKHSEAISDALIAENLTEATRLICDLRKR
ncbi:MAG: D-glycero-alpha-D-manno-heptose-1,7-bisphosphate 7-phosphatase [Limisphaerales bacterium]